MSIASGSPLQISQSAGQLSDTAPQSGSDPAHLPVSEPSPESGSQQTVQHEQQLKQDSNDLSHLEPEQQQQEPAIDPMVLSDSAGNDSSQDTQQQVLLAQPDHDDHLHSNTDGASSDSTDTESPMLGDTIKTTASPGPSASASASESDITQKAEQQAHSHPAEDATAPQAKTEDPASIVASDTGQHQQPLLDDDAHQTETAVIMTENGHTPVKEDPLPQHLDELDLDAELHDEAPQPNSSTNGVNLVAQEEQEHGQGAALPQALQGWHLLACNMAPCTNG